MRYKLIACIVITLLIVAGLYAFAGDATLTKDASGLRNVIQGIFRPATARTVETVNTTWARSDSLTSNIIQIYAAHDCFFKVGNYTVDADSLDHLLKGGIPATISVDNYEYIAFKAKAAAADTVFITEWQ